MEVEVKESAECQPCELCGSLRAMEFGDQWVCEDCYHGRSSCCPEFGKDDLWVFEEEEEEEAERTGRT